MSAAILFINTTVYSFFGFSLALYLITLKTKKQLSSFSSTLIFAAILAVVTGFLVMMFANWSQTSF